MAIKVTWLSHSGFLLDINGTSVVIDPFLTGNPLATISPDAIAADYILVTHGHDDHLGDTVPIAKRTNATVIASPEICAWLQKQGVQRTHGQTVGSSEQYPFGQVSLVKAEHGSSLPDKTEAGPACGIVLTADNKKLYFAGDTALFPDMQAIGKLGIEAAFLPIGGKYTMGPDESLQAVELIKPQAVFPIHYNTWDEIQQDVVRWAQRVHNTTSAKAIVLDPGTAFFV
jgi:L-ascorbate metabolism protein UlaG (beta-lactamase superfamily)